MFCKTHQQKKMQRSAHKKATQAPRRSLKRSVPLPHVLKLIETKSGAIDDEVRASAIFDTIARQHTMLTGEQEHQRRTKWERGSGAVGDPLVQQLPSKPNASNCKFCHTSICFCNYFTELFERTFEKLQLKRITEVAGKRAMCAKSLLPPFVTRLAKLMTISSSDTFYDLGCGNGSILFQMAFLTGARCIGVELCPHNAELARQAWTIIKPQLEQKAKRAMPEVTIITGDIAEFISSPTFGASPNTAILTSNLLFPRPLTHFMSERFRLLAPSTRIVCFDDLFPHARSISKLRDPDAHERFEMIDCVWTSGHVEWCSMVGNFYLHIRR